MGADSLRARAREVAGSPERAEGGPRRQEAHERSLARSPGVIVLVEDSLEGPGEGRQAGPDQGALVAGPLEEVEQDRRESSFGDLSLAREARGQEHEGRLGEGLDLLRLVAGWPYGVQGAEVGRARTQGQRGRVEGYGTLDALHELEEPGQALGWTRAGQEREGLALWVEGSPALEAGRLARPVGDQGAEGVERAGDLAERAFFSWDPGQLGWTGGGRGLPLGDQAGASVATSQVDLSPGAEGEVLNDEGPSDQPAANGFEF